MLREVRNTIGPARMLRVDANMAWCPTTARQALIALDEIGVESVEEPVAGFEAMRELRRRSNIPLSAHSSDILEAAKVGGPVALVLGIAGCGGIGPTLRFAEDCKQAGVGFRFYSGDLGIATAATLHVAAAMPSVTGPHQTLLRWYHDDVISGGPFRPERGSVAVPASSGIGVDLDEAALARGIQRFAKDRAYDYYAGPSVPRY